MSNANVGEEVSLALDSGTRRRWVTRVWGLSEMRLIFWVRARVGNLSVGPV